jgi:hypothetical protein
MAEIKERFGISTKQREELFKRLEYFVELARHCHAIKVLIDGSFVTAKLEPGDVDIVIRLDNSHEDLLDKADPKAFELERIFESRQPKEAVPAYFEDRWEDWVAFFTKVKGNTTLRKGVLEIKP